MNDWTQISYSTLHKYGQEVVPITSSCFDECHELVWIGNEKGYLTSYYGPELRRYTSVRAYESPVSCILSNERGILSLSNQSIRLMNRRGLFQWSLSDLNMSDLQCMTFISRSSNILVGGLQSSMLVINFERGVVIDTLVYLEIFFFTFNMMKAI